MAIDGKIILAKELAARLGIFDNCQILIRAGSITLQAEAKVREIKHRSYILSPSLRVALHIQKKRRMLLRYDQKQNTLHLGPTVGVLATGLPNREIYDPTGLQAELMMLSKIGRKMAGQTFIFMPDSLNWDRKIVRGYNYVPSSSGRGHWVANTYPIPDVVYDRIASRNSEVREKVKRSKNRLKSLPNLHYFNPSFLNKWKVYQLLYNYPDLRPHLPETHLLDLLNLETMLSKYQLLFIKPANGSLGFGIIRVKTNESGQLSYSTYGVGRRNGIADDASELLKKTNEFRRDRSYIVQQGLYLSTYKGSTFDLRIIYQKNSRGEWQVGKKFVRVAPGGSSIANMARGGTAYTSRKVFSYLYSKKAVIEEKNRQIKDLCERIAVGIEQGSGQLFGELGLDLGIDKSGHVWLIEVNSKPRKTTETDFSEGIMRNAFKRPLEYAAYLAGFSREK